MVASPTGRRTNSRGKFRERGLASHLLIGDAGIGAMNRRDESSQSSQSRLSWGIELVDALRRAFQDHPVKIEEAFDDSFGEVWVEVVDLEITLV